MALGIASDATTIYVEDNSNADAGGDGSYSEADVFTKLGGTGVDILRLDGGSAGFPTYRWLKSLQVGATGGTTATTFLSNVGVNNTFDATRVVKNRATALTLTSWQLGTKVGATGGKKGGLWSFNTAAACQIRGIINLYGVTMANAGTGNLQILPGATGNGSEVMACNFDQFGAFVFGTTGAHLDTMYDVTMNPSTAGNAITSFFVDSAQKIKVAGNPASYVASSTAGLAFKDVEFVGTPTGGDLAMGAVLSTNWVIIRPSWSGNGPKFALGGPTSADTGAHEYWLYGLKAVDRAGMGVASIPVTLTDNLGNVVVSTTTTSVGRISFGSGLTANGIITMDHYYTGSVYAQRHRSPFTYKVNTPDLAGYNPAYLSRVGKFYWPGYTSIALTSGTFEDVADIVPIEDQSGVPTTWVESTL